MSAERRRRKAAEREAFADELDVRWAFRLDRLPLRAIALDVCSCGWAQWLMPGADEEAFAAYYEASSDHSWTCVDLDEAV